MGEIEAFLIFAVAAFDLAIVSGCVGTDEFVVDAHLFSRFLKKCQLLFGRGETVGKLTAIVGLDTLDLDTPALEPGDGLFQEVGRGIGRLFCVGA